MDKDALNYVEEINWARPRWNARNVRIEDIAARDETRKNKTLGLKHSGKLAGIFEAPGVECEIVGRIPPSS